MQQLIEKLIENPFIILALISWPLFLFLSDLIIQKIVIKKYKCKLLSDKKS